MLLTPNHLKDAVLAGEVFRQIVVHREDEALRCFVQQVLFDIGLELCARRIDVVASGVVGIYRAVDAVSRRSSQRMLIEASLRYDAVGVIQVSGVAYKKLYVALRRTARDVKGKTDSSLRMFQQGSIGEKPPSSPHTFVGTFVSRGDFRHTGNIGWHHDMLQTMRAEVDVSTSCHKLRKLVACNTRENRLKAIPRSL